jgi:hypothetical protein
MMQAFLRATWLSVLVLAGPCAGTAATAQSAPAPGAYGAMGTAETAPGLRYPALADLVVSSPVIVRAVIVKAQAIPERLAPGLAPGMARMLVTADVEAALVAPAAVPPKLSWLYDVKLDGRGRVPALRGRRVMAWLETPGADGKATLTRAWGQQDWSEALATRVRALATEVTAGRVPEITGVTNGFRVEGTVPGESESQFFLATKAGRPLTMVVLERPGQSLKVAVADGDIIDDSATSVMPETLLWYRLACGLPATLPVAAGGNDVALANAWIGALASLGPCER